MRDAYIIFKQEEICNKYRGSGPYDRCIGCPLRLKNRQGYLVCTKGKISSDFVEKELEGPWKYDI